jgi:hypothetical protein
MAFSCISILVWNYNFNILFFIREIKMQKVIYDNSKSNFIQACDVKEEGGKIYCYSNGIGLRFLTKTKGRYRWIDLFLNSGIARGGTQDGYDNFKEALMECYDLDVMIFKNQCEVLSWARNNF